MFKFFPALVLGILITSTAYTAIACDPEEGADPKVYQLKEGSMGAFAPEDIERALIYKQRKDEAAYEELVSRHILLKFGAGIQVYHLGCANPDCGVIKYRVIGSSVIKYTTLDHVI